MDGDGSRKQKKSRPPRVWLSKNQRPYIIQGKKRVYINGTPNMNQRQLLNVVINNFRKRSKRKKGKLGQSATHEELVKKAEYLSFLNHTFLNKKEDAEKLLKRLEEKMNQQPIQVPQLIQAPQPIQVPQPIVQQPLPWHIPQEIPQERKQLSRQSFIRVDSPILSEYSTSSEIKYPVRRELFISADAPSPEPLTPLSEHIQYQSPPSPENYPDSDSDLINLGPLPGIKSEYRNVLDYIDEETGDLDEAEKHYLETLLIGGIHQKMPPEKLLKIIKTSSKDIQNKEPKIVEYEDIGINEDLGVNEDVDIDEDLPEPIPYDVDEKTGDILTGFLAPIQTKKRKKIEYEPYGNEGNYISDEKSYISKDLLTDQVPPSSQEPQDIKLSNILDESIQKFHPQVTRRNEVTNAPELPQVDETKSFERKEPKSLLEESKEIGDKIDRIRNEVSDMLRLSREQGAKNEISDIKIIDPKAEQGAGKAMGGLWSDQLEKIMHRYRKFEGVYPIDQINRMPVKDKMGAIVNLSRSNQPGSHWVAFYIDTKNDRSLEYYDSYARDPPKEFMQNIKSVINRLAPDVYLKFKVNKIKQQSANSSNCGIFCAKFLTDRFEGRPFKQCTGYSDVRSGEAMARKLREKYHDFGYI